MSHIHIPDGVADNIWWLLVLSYIVVILLLMLIFKRVDREEVGRKVPLVAIMSAVMLIAMSVPMGFLPFHINLAALCGILVGYELGFIAVFVINLLLSFVGHGGITVVGLNSIILGIEMALAYIFYRRLAQEGKEGILSFLSTALALLISTTVSIIIIILIMGDGPKESILNHSHIKDGGLLIFFIVLAIGITLESTITGLIVAFLSKVKPDLIRPSERH
ncbi:MAG: energy-coupling factor ABC transporter permease [Clostridiales bacterium]|nr:energy-coupling factor ABC transporter permease [Clostridiales bacterium]